MDQKAITRRNQLLQSISTAIDRRLPIPPLHELITQYAEFIPRWTSLTMPGGSTDFEFLSAITACNDDDRSADGSKSFMITDRNANRIYRVGLTLNEVKTIDIFAATDRVHSRKETAAVRPFCWPTAICADPARRGRYFLADDSSVRIADGQTISLLAGQNGRLGCRNGLDAAFKLIMDCVSTPDGQTLYIADSGNRLVRAVDVSTGRVETVVGNKQFASASDSLMLKVGRLYPRQLALHDYGDIGRVLFMTATTALSHYILRFIVESKELIPIDLKTNGATVFPEYLYCLANGTIIFNCNETQSIYAANPMTGDTELIGCNPVDKTADDGVMLRQFVNVFVDDATQTIFAIDRLSIYRIDAPPHLFWKSSS